MPDNKEVLDPEYLKKFVALPTGKLHISFSELRDWQDCPYRHKLKFVDQLDAISISPVLDFGTAIHAACENYLSTREMKVTIFETKFRELFDLHKKDNEEEYTEDAFKNGVLQATAICADVPGFLEEKFPGWEYVDAEYFLYEPMQKYPHAFKGFIDGIIKVKVTGKRGAGKELFWLLDWKTCMWGWPREKKTDAHTLQQLVFYKHFWSLKTQTPLKDIRCGFVLLKKRPPKDASCCELVTVSVGDVTLQRTLKSLNNAMASIEHGIVLKNRDSCKYCAFKNTPRCAGSMFVY